MENNSGDFEKIDASAAEEVFELMKACSEDMVAQGFNHWVEYYSKAEIIKRRLDYGETFVVYSPEGKAIATVSLSSNPPPYYLMNDEGVDYRKAFTPVERGKALYISAVGVHPDYQHSGLGRKVMAFVEQNAKERGMESIRFDTRAEFTRVVEFYSKLGYRQLEKVMITTDPNENYFLFEKVLNET